MLLGGGNSFASLYWSGLTALDAKVAMVAGFLSVPFFKFGAPALFPKIGLQSWVARLEDLDMLLPSFLTGFLVGVVVSRFDKQGRARLKGIDAELRDARS